ncbi:LOW QUALITY PROTEIN: protein crumbs homolog 2 [Rhinatrema bivittatum]|uniref:LOW QUALITY PROTEIN: protein crumbs homolog 2 n=1 Tax=Rhinatrema bivittatum TaxID=194408 RepID=UPI00112B19B3|nr:LOW QUALITY PROTEIN: protein crumbs homolog 2 [Rhinatrema bivittatum]
MPDDSVVAMELKRDNTSFYNTLVLLPLSLFVWGVLCSDKISNCSSDPCQNGASCMDTENGYKCLCSRLPPVYIGKKCELLYDACTLEKCPFNRTCSSTLGSLDYKCICRPGFTGADCSININECESNPCRHPNAECIDQVNGYICQCQKGSNEEACQMEMSACLSNPCQNNATCIDEMGNYTCSCDSGFHGAHCEKNIDECASNPCQNGAICIDEVNKYSCFCVPGFQGFHCEIDINECASRPCKNNGTCFNEMDHYVCKCVMGYTGLNCETEIDECESNPCHNAGTCNDYVGLYTCTCFPGYEGTRCEVDINECESQPCKNGGTCKDLINGYQCNCSDTGFTGEECETDILECASGPCLNNATCLEGVKNYSCVCWPGYIGKQCEIDKDECLEGPCQNGALCFERSNQAYYGDLLKFNKEFSYMGAAGYICQCQPGFAGENCSTNIDECESQPCQNGGSCYDLVNGFHCHCVLGFTGISCAININECENNVCENGGTCEDGIGDYMCHCPPMDKKGNIWGGKNCSVKLTGCLGNLCQNEALCIPTYEGETQGYKCQCQPGFYDESCTTSTTFSFTSATYITLDLLTNQNEKKKVVHLAFRFRTTLPNVLLLYRGSEAEYLYLELYNGFLHTVLKRNGTSSNFYIYEQRLHDGEWHPVQVVLNNSLVLMLWHKNCSHGICTESFPLDEKNATVLDSFATVYIGGAEDTLLYNTMSQQSFIGCLEDLQIDFTTVLPQNIISHPGPMMGLGCSKTEWCHPNPCYHGGVCIDLWTWFRCECIRPYEGPLCLHEYIAGTFSMEGKSSLASFSINNHPGTHFNISGFIRSLKPTGLVMQISNETIPCFTLYLKNGRLHITTLSAKTVTFSENFADGRWHLLNIHFREGLVSITHLDKYLELGQLTPITLVAGYNIYIGGLPLGSSLDEWGGCFKGCLQDMRLNVHRMEFFPSSDYNYSLPQEAYVGQMRNITQNCLSDDTCNPDPCKNEGTCIVTWNDFECYCPANFTGKTCEKRVWCESNPCPKMTNCKNVPQGYACLANATFQSKGVVKYILNTSIAQDLTAITLNFRTRATNAILLHATKEMDSLQIGIQNSFLFVNIRSGNSLEGVHFLSDTDVSDALWHSVVLLMEDPLAVSSRWLAQLDSSRNMTLQGHAGSLNFLQEEVLMNLAENFTGCLGQVSVGGIYLPFTEGQLFPQQAQFVKYSGALQLGCNGADVCSVSPCLNNGVCQDLFNSFSCACKAGWEGPQCEANINDCESSPCVHGNCTDLVATYQCTCYSGYTGRNCNTNVDDCQQHQCLNGGTCIDGINAYTCSCTAQYTGTHCEWLYPPEKCGKNVTCLNDGKCTSGFWGANCTCRPGFTGKTCQININDCESNPCLNGGTCQDLVNKYKCICNASFTGGRCEKGNPGGIFPFPLIGVAVPVACGCVLLLVIGLIFMVLTARKRRQSEGTYSPSQQEVAGARLEMDNVLKVPPEERLI